MDLLDGKNQAHFCLPVEHELHGDMTVLLENAKGRNSSIIQGVFVVLAVSPKSTDIQFILPQLSTPYYPCNQQSSVVAIFRKVESHPVNIAVIEFVRSI